MITPYREFSIDYASDGVSNIDVEGWIKVVEISALTDAQEEIEQLKRTYYLLRCEIQSYINEKEAAIFNENQATKYAENLKEEIEQLKSLMSVQLDMHDKLKAADKEIEKLIEQDRIRMATIDGNIHIVPKNEIHNENAYCHCQPIWDEKNKNEFQSGEADCKVYIHRTRKEREQ